MLERIEQWKNKRLLKGVGVTNNSKADVINKGIERSTEFTRFIDRVTVVETCYGLPAWVFMTHYSDVSFQQALALIAVACFNQLAYDLNQERITILEAMKFHRKLL